MTFLDEDYWTERYISGKTGWDIGFASPPIVQYLDQIENRVARILFPGAGNGFEAFYAYQNGFQNVVLLDLAMEPLQRFRRRNPGFPEDQLVHRDFFDHQGTYDLILEQTFFCALEPRLRPMYAEKMRDLLKPGGKLAGVWFDREFDFDGPPFGGSKEEYRDLFDPYFTMKTISPCYNSVPERTGSEVFIILENSKI